MGSQIRGALFWIFPGGWVTTRVTVLEIYRVTTFKVSKRGTTGSVCIFPGRTWVYGLGFRNGGLAIRV